MQMAFIPGPPSFAILQTCDGYDAARILLPEIRKVLIEKITGSDRGTVLVGIPNRDFLIAWPETMPADLEKSIRAQVVADAKNQHHPLSSQPMRITLETITPAN